ncbi:hypothetical protein AB1Y20_015430 [Prymnesium parvum]|uniref:Uncharacterized protein n=1 Tax=Prymnesium parvum TaxID=97485 RepID=A0AB34K2J1_PRYPA
MESEDELCVCLDADGRVHGSHAACPDASFRVFDRLLSLRPAALHALRRECLLASWPLAAGSFWLHHAQPPRGPLEALARRIFELHTDSAALDREATAGAEWWANVSRSEAMARGGGYGDIAFHFDKDEGAHEAHGLIIHPVLSTVTYLSDSGAPTVVVSDATVSPVGEYSACRMSAHLVPPRVGRHLRFDGRLLHGAPRSILPPAGEEAGSYERVTFCVNIWVGHKPRRCGPFTTPSSLAPTDHIDFRLRQTDPNMALNALKAQGRTVHISPKESRPRSARVNQSESSPQQHRIECFELHQTSQPHTLFLALPNESTLRRALGNATVLTIASPSIAVCKTSSSDESHLKSKREELPADELSNCKRGKRAPRP